MSAGYLTLLSKLGKGTFHPGGFPFTKRVLASYPPQEHTRILDAGCGYGETSVYLASQYNCLVTGVDFQSAMIRAARRRNTLKEKRVSYRVADITKLPFSSGSYDMVMTESVLCFVSLPQALSELKRVLRPGGRLMAIESVLLKKMPDPLWEEFKHFYGFTSLYTAKGMKEALRKAGFSTAFHTTLHPFRPASTINPIASYASFGVTEWNQLIKNNDLLIKGAPYLGFTSFHARCPH